MILHRPIVEPDALEATTGWRVADGLACRDGACVRLTEALPLPLPIVAERLHMPLVHDERHGLWCLGPEADVAPLASALLPPVVLPDIHGTPFDVASLLGTKVLLVAWSPW